MINHPHCPVLYPTPHCSCLNLKANCTGQSLISSCQSFIVYAFLLYLLTHNIHPLLACVPECQCHISSWCHFFVVDSRSSHGYITHSLDELQHADSRSTDPAEMGRRSGRVRPPCTASSSRCVDSPPKTYRLTRRQPNWTVCLHDGSSGPGDPTLLVSLRKLRHS